MIEEKIFKIILTLVGLLFALIIVLFGDYLFHIEITSKCNIKGKHYKSAYTSITNTYVNNQLIPQVQYHPEEWGIVTDLENKEELNYSVSKDEYDKLQINNIKTCIYHKTIFLGIKYGRFIND